MKDFKEFALKGNVIDLAIAVVIGAAFGKVVTSLVNDIIMPIIGTFTGGIDFSKKMVVLHPAVLDATGKFQKAKEEAPAQVPAPTPDQQLLTEIRDLLKSRN